MQRRHKRKTFKTKVKRKKVKSKNFTSYRKGRGGSRI